MPDTDTEASVPDGAFKERLLEAPDVCLNCHRPIRVERVEPTRTGVIREFETHYARHPVNTEIAYGPAESVTNVKGTFCDRCGTESAYDRVTWTPDDVSRRRFRALTKQTIATLEHKGVSLSRTDFSEHALAHFSADVRADVALAKATEAAIVAEAASGSGSADTTTDTRAEGRQA